MINIRYSQNFSQPRDNTKSVKNFSHFLFILAIFFWGLPSQKLLAESWELSKEAVGVKVFTRTVPDSPLKEFKATTRLESSLSGVIALFRDDKNMPAWWPDCRESKTLKEISPTEWVVYFVVGAPWPVNARDTINHIVLSQDPKSKIVTMKIKAMPEFSAPVPNQIRIPYLLGSWQFTPIEGGFIDVVYQVHANPGGSIPNWLANRTVVDAPHKALLKLKSEVKKEKYQNAKLSYIAE